METGGVYYAIQNLIFVSKTVSYHEISFHEINSHEIRNQLLVIEINSHKINLIL